MSKIKGFTFFKSYYDSLCDLEPEDKKEMLNAILEYVFEDKKPRFKGFKKTFWTLIEPNLDTSKHRSNDNSGAPIGNQNARKNKAESDTIEKQSKNNQKTTNDLLGKDKDKDREKDKELDKDKGKEKECYSPAPISLDDLIDYGESIGVNIEYCEKFYNTYESTGWINKNGQKITNAKSLLKKWASEDKEKQQETKQEERRTL